jgi:hypothetical protein
VGFRELVEMMVDADIELEKTKLVVKRKVLED